MSQSESTCRKRQEQIKQEANGRTSMIYRCTHKECSYFTKKVSDDICAVCPLRVPMDVVEPPKVDPRTPIVLDDGTIVYTKVGQMPPPPHPGYRRKSNVIDSADAWIFIPEGNFNGAGTELHRLLAKIGIHPTATCQCRARMREMDSQGTQWCRDNVEQIIDWMQEEAKNRNLPFVRFIGRRMVFHAIRNAEAKHSQT